MRKHMLATLIITVSTIVLMAPAAASAAQESGSSSKWPWSGYWWPMLSTEANMYDQGGPLQKYDAFIRGTSGYQSQSQLWEQQNHMTTNAANTWWGHCHAWAAASILTAEPPANYNSGGVHWTTNDTKGLVTELYYSPKYTWLSGRRVDSPNDTTSAAYADIAPAWMDYLLRYYVGYYKYPFIMDISANSEVWNFPVFAYNRNSTALADGSENVTTTVWYSSPDYNATGTKYFSRTYTYTLKGGTLGTWTGNSVKDHPDFAWVPTGKDASAHINEAVVEQIVGHDV